MGNLYIGLLHYPVLNRAGQPAISALTGLDVHDIARSAKTYGVERFFVVTPLPSQQGIAARIKRYWLESKVDHNRSEALRLVRIVARYEDSVELIERAEGQRPLLIGTSARELDLGRPRLGYGELRRWLESDPRPVYILFGTAWGLTEGLLRRLDYLLEPIYGPGEYNHLSVRAAVAAILDRLRGKREGLELGTEAEPEAESALKSKSKPELKPEPETEAKE